MALLTEAALSEDERRLVERLVEELRAELGESLRAVWLYGSRARGERGPDSDIDLLVITADAAEIESGELWRLGERVSIELGMGGAPVSILHGDLSWLAERRGVEAFYVKEVDRDKLVLYGDGLEEVGREEVGREEGGAVKPDGLLRGDGATSGEGIALSPRTEEYLVRARQHLAAAQRTLEDENVVAISPAYTSMLNAARALLSEEDLFARTHSGTWHLFHQTFVLDGAFDAELQKGAADAQELREDVDYKAIGHPVARAREVVAHAERFLAEVERVLAS